MSLNGGSGAGQGGRDEEEVPGDWSERSGTCRGFRFRPLAHGSGAALVMSVIAVMVWGSGEGAEVTYTGRWSSKRRRGGFGDGSSNSINVNNINSSTRKKILRAEYHWYVVGTANNTISCTHYTLFLPCCTLVVI